EIDAELQRSLRARKVEELHDLAELLRYRYGLAPPPADEMRSLVERGRAIWAEKSLLTRAEGDAPGDPTEATLRADLLELAAVWPDFRVRPAPAEEAREARDEALRVLDEASAAFGPSPALERERAAYSAEPEPPVGPRPTFPAPKTAWEHYDLGRSYIRSGQTPQAAEEFRRALELRPQDFWPNFYQGLCSYRLRSPREGPPPLRPPLRPRGRRRFPHLHRPPAGQRRVLLQSGPGLRRARPGRPCGPRLREGPGARSRTRRRRFEPGHPRLSFREVPQRDRRLRPRALVPPRP